MLQLLCFAYGMIVFLSYINGINGSPQIEPVIGIVGQDISIVCHFPSGSGVRFYFNSDEVGYCLNGISCYPNAPYSWSLHQDAPTKLYTLTIPNFNDSLCGTYRCVDSSNGTNEDRLDVLAGFNGQPTVVEPSNHRNGEVSLTFDCVLTDLTSIEWFYIIFANDTMKMKTDVVELIEKGTCSSTCNGLERKVLKQSFNHVEEQYHSKALTVRYFARYNASGTIKIVNFNNTYNITDPESTSTQAPTTTTTAQPSTQSGNTTANDVETPTTTPKTFWDFDRDSFFKGLGAGLILLIVVVTIVIVCCCRRSTGIKSEDSTVTAPSTGAASDPKKTSDCSTERAMAISFGVLTAILIVVVVILSALLYKARNENNSVGPFCGTQTVVMETKQCTTSIPINGSIIANSLNSEGQSNKIKPVLQGKLDSLPDARIEDETPRKSKKKRRKKPKADGQTTDTHTSNTKNDEDPATPITKPSSGDLAHMTSTPNVTKTKPVDDNGPTIVPTITYKGT